MDTLLQLYLVSGGIGFVYIIGSAAMGFTHGGQDSGDISNADSADIGGADGADFNGADSGDLGNADSGDLSNLETAQLVKANVASFRTGTATGRRGSIALLMLKLLSPSTMATFGFFFGLSGYLSLHYLPFLSYLSLAIAIICGIIGYKAMSRFTNALVAKMHSSNSYNHNDVIGRVAEVTVSIAPGKLGEITYAAGGVRDTAPAKAADAKLSFAASTKVMISDEADGVFVVEPWSDALLESSGTIETQEIEGAR